MSDHLGDSDFGFPEGEYDTDEEEQQGDDKADDVIADETSAGVDKEASDVGRGIDHAGVGVLEEHAVKPDGIEIGGRGGVGIFFQILAPSEVFIKEELRIFG